MLNTQLHLDHNHNNLDNKLEQTSLEILIYWIDLQGDNHSDYLFEALFLMILLDILLQPFNKCLRRVLLLMVENTKCIIKMRLQLL